MAKSVEEKQRASQARARQIADRIVRYQPTLMSEREWLQRAEVSPSFFSNMRGTPTKPPSVPSVENLEKVLGVAGVSLAEFFVPDADVRFAPVPSAQALETAVREALVELPRRATDRAAYLVEAVQGVLGLPASRRATRSTDQSASTDDHEATALPRAASR